MASATYQLLLNEGHLLQGCFKAALVALRRNEQSIDRAGCYAASFNYAIGLERLLKILLLLDHWKREHRFPDTEALRSYGGKSGHDIERLHAAATALQTQYGVACPAGFEPDDVDKRLLRYFSDFAKSSRYFNLDSIAGKTAHGDPIPQWHGLLQEVHQRDVTECKRIHEADQMEGVISLVEPFVVHTARESMSGQPQSFRDMVLDQSMIARTLPAMILRLLKALVPLKELLLIIREQIHTADRSSSNVPFMEEFLDFVCKDRAIVEEPADEWP